MEPFVFQYAGQSFELPNAGNLKFGVLRKASKEPDELKQMVAILEGVADEPTLAVLDDMSVIEIAAVVGDWQKHGGVTMGES